MIQSNENKRARTSGNEKVFLFAVYVSGMESSTFGNRESTEATRRLILTERIVERTVDANSLARHYL